MFDDCWATLDWQLAKPLCVCVHADEPLSQVGMAGADDTSDTESTARCTSNLKLVPFLVRIIIESLPSRRWWSSSQRTRCHNAPQQHRRSWHISLRLIHPFLSRSPIPRQATTLGPSTGYALCHVLLCIEPHPTRSPSRAALGPIYRIPCRSRSGSLSELPLSWGIISHTSRRHLDRLDSA